MSEKAQKRRKTECFFFCFVSGNLSKLKAPILGILVLTGTLLIIFFFLFYVTGMKYRVLNVLYEDSQEPTYVEAEPTRQPWFEDHLTEDQRELLALKLSEYATGKRTMGLQTGKF